MNLHENNNVSIEWDKITLRFGNMESIVIPRASLRTRLQLIKWVYRLTGWPGMNLLRMRAFIAAVFGYHGWELPETKDGAVLTERTQGNEVLLPSVSEFLHSNADIQAEVWSDGGLLVR